MLAGKHFRNFISCYSGVQSKRFLNVKILLLHNEEGVNRLFTTVRYKTTFHMASCHYIISCCSSVLPVLLSTSSTGGYAEARRPAAASCLHCRASCYRHDGQHMVHHSLTSNLTLTFWMMQQRELQAVHMYVPSASRQAVNGSPTSSRGPRTPLLQLGIWE